MDRGGLQWRDRRKRYAPMRVMGIDLGGKRTGIAISDESEFLASGICTIRAKSLADLIAQICDLITKNKVGKLVVGHPINMDGTRGASAKRAAEFAEMLKEKTGLPVELYDERCTTMAAHTILNYTDTRAEKRKAVIDTLSAEMILQDWLDANRRKGN